MGQKTENGKYFWLSTGNGEHDGPFNTPGEAIANAEKLLDAQYDDHDVRILQQVREGIVSRPDKAVFTETK